MHINHVCMWFISSPQQHKSDKSWLVIKHSLVCIASCPVDRQLQFSCKLKIFGHIAEQRYGELLCQYFKMNKLLNIILFFD